MGLPDYDAGVLTQDRETAAYFDAVARRCADPKAASNWVMTEVLRQVKAHGGDWTRLRVHPEELGALLAQVAEGRLSTALAKAVFARMAESGEEAGTAVRALGGPVVRDGETLSALVDEALRAQPRAAEDVRAGHGRALGVLVGEVLRRSGGRAEPRAARRLLRVRLGLDAEE